MKELYVASCCRTAVGAFQGSLSNTPAAELGAVVVKAALERAGQDAVRARPGQERAAVERREEHCNLFKKEVK